MIIKLHDNLINKIAAGEVVERPASVLKELVENSIDAGSSKIRINIEKAGTGLVEVIDNGSGMTKEDAKLACNSHTTSKITTIQDLDKIDTMGFRGEALASIASVSKLTLETKTHEESSGIKIVIDNGKKQAEEEISKDIGTKISVIDLFHKIPARRKFLKSDSTEYKHILSVFYNYALSYPHIQFTLTHNGTTVHKLPSVAKDSFNKEFLFRINDLFKERISKNLVEINYSSPYLQTKGFTGHPKISTSRKSYQLIFLNNRPITDKLISKAIYDSYQGLMPKNRYPIFFLFIEMDPAVVDVNVHPRKSEVRFSNSSQIYTSVKQASKQSILKLLKHDTKRALDQYSDFPTSTQRKSLGVHQKINLSQKKDPKKTSRVSKKLISDSISFTEKILQPSVGLPGKNIHVSSRAFQIFKSFLLYEKEDNLVIVDQHAAAERVTYEKLLKQLDKRGVETQVLLLPETIELSSQEFELLKSHRKYLDKLGIKLTIFGKETFKVEEVPNLISKTNVNNLIQDILSDLKSEDKKIDSFDEIKKHLVATMACHSSIRAGMKLEQIEIDDLIRNLLSCKSPYSCPHGRPIIWEISRNEIEKHFERH